jgi:hypothetical protein
MDNKDKGNANIGIGLCFLVLGMTQIAYSSSTRPTGRWSFVLGPLFDSFGQLGPPMFFIIFGVLFVVFGLSLRSRK